MEGEKKAKEEEKGKEGEKGKAKVLVLSLIHI